MGALSTVQTAQQSELESAAVCALPQRYAQTETAAWLICTCRRHSLAKTYLFYRRTARFWMHFFQANGACALNRTPRTRKILCDRKSSLGDRLLRSAHLHSNSKNKVLRWFVFVGGGCCGWIFRQKSSELGASNLFSCESSKPFLSCGARVCVCILFS
jgi:hypothetical protein